ncbi:MAG: MlaD family protein [Phycisphaerales bacterium JB037]
MARKNSTHTLMAGSFLLAALVGAVAVIITLSGVTLEGRTPYVVRFTLSEGAAGIEPGSPVRVGGVQAGQVERVRFLFDPQGRPTGVEVDVLISDDITLFDDAAALLESPLLGGISAINIASAGGLADDARPLPSGAVIDGGIAPPSFLAQAGFGSQQQRQVSGIISDAEQLVSKLNQTADRIDAIITRVDGELEPVLADVRAMTGDARATVRRLNDRSEAWAASVDRALADAEAFADGLEPIRAEGEALVADARGAVNKIDGVIEDNRPRIDRTLASVERAVASVNDETIPAANRFLTDLNDRNAELGDLLARVDGFLVEELPSVRRALANARLASDQLKLATAEIRAQPWRLLIRPSTKELREQLVYDSSRAYASAVSDLRAASEALQASLDAPGTQDRGRIAELQSELLSAFDRYQQAERDLLDRLVTLD